MIESLQHLVVVHINMMDLSYSDCRAVAEGVRRRVLLTLERGEKVFLMPCVSCPVFSSYALFADVISRSTVIPSVDPEATVNMPSGFTLSDPQFALLKHTLVRDRVDAADVVGVARRNCVRHVDNIVRGQPVRDIARLAEFLKINRSELETAIKTPIASRVIEDLCLD